MGPGLERREELTCGDRSGGDRSGVDGTLTNEHNGCILTLLHSYQRRHRHRCTSAQT